MLSLQYYLPVCSPNYHMNKRPFFYSSSITKFPHFSNPNSCVLKFRNSICGAADADKKRFNNDDQIVLVDQFPEGLEPELMPKHVGVIMDGNRRWAKNRGLPVQLGHRAGGKAMKQLAINCNKFGVKVVSVFAFSTENWIRPKEEVEFLMSFFEEVIKSDTKELMGHDMRVSFLGNRSRLPKSLQHLISCVEEEEAKDNKGMRLVIGMNYSGRYDITEATQKIARKVKDGVLGVEDINESLLEQHLETNGISNPDLLIRTSGELRVSNYMLWQLAYTELLFLNKLFPDFNEADLVEALAAFQQRRRRYGGHKY
ncbi:hypothetical protein BUALT_Bualt16G0001600 [Buddleja alternifolia]|uniref:Alkyl transferase n=1 Tax=Buddleja alternifolia TaxID=168488 RepID=A0AAV6W822_9LAMI|nr:hypothetical protein BUALT_Bualt16G0001600 [Buddleja alternifolia]